MASSTRDPAARGRAILRQALSCSAIGAPATVRSAIEAFVARTGADELIVTAQVRDHQARLRSFELVMQAAGPDA